MNQKKADGLADKFKAISGINCTATFMEGGINHQPTTQRSGEKGVYVFLLNESTCFKVGKANVNSAARWNSHHYCLDNTTPSTLTKSFLNDLEKFKFYFDDESIVDELELFTSVVKEYIPEDVDFKIGIKSLSKAEIKKLSKLLNLKEWIRKNISRIEFVISEECSDYGLNLLEALIQFELNPIYEGKNA
jgi:hypothetical protein